MGDIWPYGPPRYTTYNQIVIELKALGMSQGNADTGAAIGAAEGSYDLSVINDTPSTGDYSVGTFQINYIGSLGPERTRLFGTPKQLIDGGIIAQAHAMYVLWLSSGFKPWSTFNSGAYKQYLQGKGPTGPAPGIIVTPAGVPSTPGSDSWAPHIGSTSYALSQLWQAVQSYADAVNTSWR